MSHAGPTPPLELELALLALLLLEELLVPELPLVPLVPLDPELLDPLVPELLDPLAPELVPVSGVPLSASSAALVFGGSFAPGSGGGSADLVSSTAAPRPSSGDVAHAEMRATSDNVPTAMRVERRMAGTVAAELYAALARRVTRR